MGSYLNPGNSGFSNMRNDVYVDKTEMISLINQTINTPRNLTCISRPRRFGKSFAAKMLCAYYDKTCDSKELFDDLKIAKDDEYLKYLNQMAEEFSLDNDVRVSTLSRYPEVFTMEECSEDEDELWNGLKEALEGAFSQFVEMRTKEGERLKEDILLKLDLLSEQIRFIEERSPQIIAEYRTKLEEKMRELLEDTQIDDNRIAAEVILFADKICTDEEVVRLKSHIQHMKETLEESNGIGRKLDFIAQEMNREANTILSKANDLDISNRAISLKTEIEKIREQIQNIE